MGRCPNSTSMAPNSEPGWPFKFHAKKCGISIGHTFGPIELKFFVLPIVIQDQKNITEITVKSIKFGFQQVP
jgi:hypothetical protein